MEEKKCPFCGTRLGLTSNGMCLLHSVLYNNWAASVPDHKYMSVEERKSAFEAYQQESAIWTPQTGWKDGAVCR